MANSFCEKFQSVLNVKAARRSCGGADVGSIALEQAVLDASSEHQNNKDQQHQAQATAGVIAPVSAVRPCGDDPKQHEKK
jgi:hypothetical protein